MSRRRIGAFAAAVATACAALALSGSTALASSVAYLEAGNVWLASPDGTQKVQLTTTGTPAKPWLGVAQAPDGRTAAIYNNDPSGYANSRLQWFKVWDRTGNEIKDLPLQSKDEGTFVNRPLAFEISDDGDWTANEWSYCVILYSPFNPCASLPHGAWLTLTTLVNVLDPLEISDARQMTFFGNRLVYSDGSAIRVQKAAAAPGGTDSDLWTSPPPGAAFKRADVPPTGGKVAIEVYQSAGTPTNTIQVVPFSGDAGTGALDYANGCDLPATGSAHSVAWSPDGSQIAWRDNDGLKVAGAPVLPHPESTPCSLTSPPVLISAVAPKDSPDLKNSVYLTTAGPSFGGADVGAILAARKAASTPPPPASPASPPAGPAAGGSGLTITLPAGQKASALTKGLSVKILAAAAGRIDGKATIPAPVAKRLKIPATIAAGHISAKRAGQSVTLKLTLTKKARRKLKKLRGVKVTVRVTQGARRSSITVVLR